MTIGGVKLAELPTEISPESLVAVAADLGLSDAELAQVLGVSQVRVAAWMRGTPLPPIDPESPMLSRFRQLRSLHDRLQDTFVPTGIGRWLRQENRYLSGEKPIVLVINGEFEPVNDALEALDAGVFI